MKASKKSVYEIVTDRICELLEKGNIPWRKPWTGTHGGFPRSMESGKLYRGINHFLLSCADFESPYWLTFNQARNRGGQVRKGEKGTPIIFFQWKEYEKTSSNGETVKEQKPILRYYVVMNIEQIDGIEAPKGEEIKDFGFDPIAEAETIIHNMPNRPHITHNEQRAYYQPALDMVNMPKATSFEQAEGYYSVLFHELAHSTGHESRLARERFSGMAAFGDETYSREELVAEFGAAFLCGHARIEPATIENSAAYIQGWIKRIKSDPRLIVTAAAQGQKAADYILGQHGTDGE
ncbi:MAG: DUF1738 domain-containing protein [Sphaerochaeta sp.]|nr:DUF1738 domain-containing protein [Sphaerochaeta sp.]